MKIPAKIQKLVNKQPVEPALHFVEIISRIKKEPCLRLFAYKVTKTYGRQVKEVGRRFIDRDLLSGSLYYTHLGGYQVVWKNKKRVGYYTINEDNRFYEVTDKSDMQYPKRYFYRMYNAGDLQTAFKGVDEWLDYLYVPELKVIDDSMNYLRMYREHPKLEMLAKAGFGYLWDNKQIYRIGYDYDRKVMNFLKNNKNYVINNKPNFGWICGAIKRNMNAEQYAFYLKIEELSERLKHYKYLHDDIVEMAKYIIKQESDIDTYCDYIYSCEKVGSKIHDRGVMFPHNLKESHDNVLKLIDEKENAKTNEGLKKAFEIIKPFIENTGEFQLVIPTTQQILVEWGNTLHCCVGKLGYGAKMAKGDTIVLGIFHHGKIVECCEVGKYEKENNMRLIQCHGDHNLDSPYHTEARNLALDFITRYQPQNRMGIVI